VFTDLAVAVADGEDVGSESATRQRRSLDRGHPAEAADPNVTPTRAAMANRQPPGTVSR